jgi:small subunit ribosomal protein S2
MEFNKVEFLEAGVQFGHYKNKWHPGMKKFIFSTKNRVHIIDFNQIMNNSITVYEQVREMANNGKNILFIGRKKQLSDIMKSEAINCESPFLVKKWPGGFLTNFKIISREISKLQNLNFLIESDSFKKFSKKEQIKIEKKRNRLNDSYEGVINLKELPKALFIMGLKSESVVVKEARIMNIPIISICDTDTNPVVVDYLIPGNDDGNKSITFFAKLISKAIIEGKNLNKEILAEDQQDKQIN